MEMFYGSLDRHNREYTPDGVKKILINAGFKNVKIDFFNSHSNWNSHTPKLFRPFLWILTDLKINGKVKISISNNTIVATARK